MGIVVTLAMLLGLVILRPTPWSNSQAERQDLRLVTFTSLSLVILGAWNLLWYGLRHFGEFWGWSAIISGLAMILAAVIIFRERSDPVGSSTSTLGAVRGLVVITLAVSFILYAVTLIQLNMGLPILGV